MSWFNEDNDYDPMDSGVERVYEPTVPRAALIAAVKVIHTWHNLQGAGRPPGPGLARMLDDAWHIYWRNSPEMAPIREALAGVDLDNPEAL